MWVDPYKGNRLLPVNESDTLKIKNFISGYRLYCNEFNFFKNIINLKMYLCSLSFSVYLNKKVQPLFNIMMHEARVSKCNVHKQRASLSTSDDHPFVNQQESTFATFELKLLMQLKKKKKL